MGVTGLWQILQPCARPIKIETLNRKRLAIDASIWIYQFLKAVRDKEGNALRNSHVVGFFRRICKLLFFGIKPVFVFDGGAPALKRQTIRSRKARREGRREDAARTAGKLLAVQMQRAAEEENARRQQKKREEEDDEPAVPEEGLVYVDELHMSEKERQQNTRFRKTDAYHLPQLDVSISEMGAPNDPRVMSLEELQDYARQFEAGEDINIYDFSKIDYDSPFFMSLPASDRYNILNAARLRSRLRMGHSKEQLDSMFPDRMAFSKFQIERVRERNELTQRLMHLNGFDGAAYGIGPGRVAGEKGREYVLVRNDGVEGGWALGVISDEGKQEQPIDVDREMRSSPTVAEDEWEDDGFEDVPIEGLNRLPKPRAKHEDLADQLTNQRLAIYQARAKGVQRRPRRVKAVPANDLFVQSSDEDGAGEGGGASDGSESEAAAGDDEEGHELQKAIAMSLQRENEEGADSTAPPDPVTDEPNGDSGDDMMDIFQQCAVAEQQPLPKGSGRAIASIVNKRAFDAAPESREISSFGVPTLKPDHASDDEDSMDLHAALAESRRTKRITGPVAPKRTNPAVTRPAAALSTRDVAKQVGFSGPLPFEKLDLGTSLLGKKKMQQRTEETQGGFENPALAAAAAPPKKAAPLPPWFSGDVEQNLRQQKMIEDDDREQAKEFQRRFKFQERGEGPLRRRPTGPEIVDLEADEDGLAVDAVEVTTALEDETKSSTAHDLEVKGESAGEGRRADMAHQIREETPHTNVATEDIPSSNVVPRQAEAPKGQVMPRTVEPSIAPSVPRPKADSANSESDEQLDWSESEDGQQHTKTAASQTRDPALETVRSPSPDFEDVEIPDTADVLRVHESHGASDIAPLSPPPPAEGEPGEAMPIDDAFDDFSDPEEEEMLRTLALEVEEHARFASQLNNQPQTTAQNIAEYERELKQLRNQQTKDRRDADEVTHIMITECQQLLRLFGLPYVTAPMEAEAQCAELVRLSLVDGIVTDDSDCFLFGGTRVYKNMFNQAKFVECYLTSDLEHEFALDRPKLIALAQLLGSDYTDGLPGVGPVTALEILGEFGSLDAFATWFTAIQHAPSNTDGDTPFRRKFRRAHGTKLFLPTAFPDPRVAQAYSTPDVDSSPDAFQWGVPDLAALRAFLMQTIGWSPDRTDEVLVPVIRDMNRRADEGTQSNITAFFDGAVGVGAAGEGFAARRKNAPSTRMGSALTRMAAQAGSAAVRSARRAAELADAESNAGEAEETGAGGKETGTVSSRNAKRKAPHSGKSRPVKTRRRKGKDADVDE